MALTSYALTAPAGQHLTSEMLSKALKRYQPAERPLLGLLPVGESLTSVNPQWEIDKWPSPAGARGVPDGVDVDDTEIRTNTANQRRMSNYGMAAREAVGLGWIAKQVQHMPGNTNSMGDAMMKLVELLQQQVEVNLGSMDNTAVAEVANTTGSTCAGIFALCDRTNTYDDATPATATVEVGKIPASFAGPVPPSGDMANIGLPLLRQLAIALRAIVHRSISYQWLCMPELRQAISALADPQGIAGNGMIAALTHIRTSDYNSPDLGVTIKRLHADNADFDIIPTDWIGKTKLNSAGAATAETFAGRVSRVFTPQSRAGIIIPPNSLDVCYGVEQQAFQLVSNGGGDRAGERIYFSLRNFHPDSCVPTIFTQP